MLENYHMITAQCMINSCKGSLIAGNPKPFDCFELVDIASISY